MKINFVAVSTHLTGGNRVIMELINGLAKKGHDMNLVTLGSEDDLDWINLKANVIYVRRNIIQKIFGYMYRMVFGFQPWPEEQTRMTMNAMPVADVSVATMSYTGIPVSRASKGVPFQLHMHYEPLIREEGYKRSIIKECYYLPVNIIANSTWVKDKIKEKTGRNSIGVVCPAIDHEIFYPRKKYKPVNKKNVKIISLAKHKRWKGIPEALETIKILRKRGYSIDFSTFGGEYPKDELSDNLKNVEYIHVGKKMNDDLAKFYSDADILISSSFYESFPLPQLEAMACGTPVVTTKYGTEDYAINEKNCLVVEPRAPEQMANAIEKLINNKEMHKKFSDEGIKTAKKFTWGSAVDKIEEIFLKKIKK